MATFKTNQNINAGEFVHQIEIKRKFSDDIDENGIPVESVKVVYRTRAKKSNESGREFYQRTGVSGDYSTKSYKFWFRSHPKLEIFESDILVYDNKEYNIVHVNDLNDRKIITELIAERTV